MSGRGVKIDLELALARARRGETADAARELTQLIRADPAEPDAYYYLARLYAHAGLHSAAKDVFRLALANAPDIFFDASAFVRYEGRAFDAETALSFFAALAEIDPAFEDYLRPSPLVGMYGSTQTQSQDDAVRRLLDSHWTDWQAGRTSPPPKADAFREHPHDATRPRVLVLMPYHVSGNPDFVPCTLAAHCIASLDELGVPAALYSADHLCFDAQNAESAWEGRRPKAAALDALEAQLREFRPDVVVMNAMFEESARTLSRADLARLKCDYGFKLVALIADGYSPLPNYAAHWGSVSDLTISLSDHGYLAAIPGPTLAAPCQPIAASLLRPKPLETRTGGLCYAGSRRRNRDFWCAHAVHAGIESTVVLTNRRADIALAQDEFYETLGNARLVLNNGAVASGLNVVTFRIFEATASGSLVLNHAASRNDDFFVPYVHFVPFETVHDLVCFSRFLLAHPETRIRMATEAVRWLNDHYSGELFWHKVFARLSGN